MNRRDFFKSGLKGTAAYTLLATTMLGGHKAAANSSSSSVSEAEEEDLYYMREEEKLARDVYLTMYDKWGLNVFANIAESEQVHTDAVMVKIAKYDLVDPVVEDIIGKFVNEELQVLYDTLVTQGNESELAALYVGAAIEEIDMIDLQHAIDQAEHRDIIRLYENLKMGSTNHMRAFVGKIEELGIEYNAQYINQDELDEILNAEFTTSVRGGRRRF